MRAAVYARVSSAGQRERHTIESQLTLLPDYVRSQGWQLVETYVDDGRSAKTGKLDARDGFARLLRDAEAKRFDVLVVVDIDRLTRTNSMEERALIIGPFQRLGIDIVTPSFGRLDVRTFLGELYVTMQALVAAEENRKRGERIKAGRLTSIRRGRKGSGAGLFGLTFDRKVEGPEAWSLHPERAAIVREMFERVAAGESCYEIGIDLETRGLVSSRGGRWTRNRVWEIVRATYPRGEWLADRERGIVVKVPPIVTHELWQRAQTAMRKAKVRGLARATHVYLLERIARCGACGGQMKIRWQSGATISHYVCATRIDGVRPRCTAPTVKTADADERVWQRVVTELEDPELPARFAAREAERVTERHDWKADEAAARRHLARLERVEATVLTRFRRGAVSEGGLDAELAAIGRERDAVQQQLDAAVRAQASLGAAGDRTVAALGVAEELRTATRSASPALRRAAIAALVVPGSVVFHGTDVELEIDIPIAGCARVPQGGQDHSTNAPMRIRVVA